MATLYQQPSRKSYTDNSGFDPIISPVPNQQSPETDTDTGTDLDNDIVIQELPTSQGEEGEVNRIYRATKLETMCGVGSYMGWTNNPDIDTHTSTADDNPFATPKQQPVGKVGVYLPTDD